MAERTEAEIIASMTNLGDSGQDNFIKDWTGFAKMLLSERGVSNTFINGASSAYIISKIITDMIEDGSLSSTTESLIATLRVNHPISEDQ